MSEKSEMVVTMAAALMRVGDLLQKRCDETMAASEKEPGDVDLAKSALASAEDFYYYTQTLQLVTKLNQEVKDLTLVIDMYQSDEAGIDKEIPKKDLN